MIFAIVFTTGCARPLYIAKSDAEEAWMSEGVRQIREMTFLHRHETNNLPENYPNTFFDTIPKTFPDTLDRSILSKVTHYNRQGNITFVQLYKGYDTIRRGRTEEYFYDPSGKRLERILLNSLEYRGRIVMEYLTRPYYRYTILCNYDDRGRLLSEIVQDRQYRWDFHYDSRDYPVAEIYSFDHNKNKQSIIHYSYDAKGRLKRIRGGRDEKYSYHSNGVLAKIREKSYMKTIKYYNENGDLEAEIERIVRKSNKGRTSKRSVNIANYRYEYDERGNWIRQTILYDGQIFTVTLRRISYWDE